MGKFSTVDEHRDNGDVAFQSLTDFEADPVVRIIKTTFPLIVLCIKPFRSDQNQHHLTFGQPLLQNSWKLRARAHVHVDKYVLSAKCVLQILADTERTSCAVVTAIAYEYFTCHLGGSPWRLFRDDFLAHPRK